MAQLTLIDGKDFGVVVLGVGLLHHVLTDGQPGTGHPTISGPLVCDFLGRAGGGQFTNGEAASDNQSYTDKC